MILHIVVDDKFIDIAYYTFEKAYPGKNKFIVVTTDKNFKYIQSTPVNTMSPLRLLSKGFMKGLSKYEFVVLHWLDDFKKQLILNAPEDVKFVWIGWGGDYYCYMQRELFLPKTKKSLKFLIQNRSTNNSMKSKLKNFIKKKFFLTGVNKTEKILNRIDFFAPVLKEDYDLLASYFDDFKPKYLDWNYGTLEDNLVLDTNLRVNGNNILVGNSATPENNHLDIFNLLKEFELKDRKIICPLSYGDKEYAEFIIKKGREYFGKNFSPITQFMSINEYNKIISTCSIVFMNHLRQQALGNIVIMLYAGAKIFMNDESPVYKFFKKNNATIFSIKEINDRELSSYLDIVDIEINRDILRKHWSRDVIIEKTKNLIETVKRYNK